MATMQRRRLLLGGDAYAGYRVYDNFNGPNGLPLASHAPDKRPPGAVWVDVDGIWTLQDGVAQNAGTGGQGVVWIDTGSADGIASAIQRTDDLQALVLRYTSPAAFWRLRGEGTTLRLYQNGSVAASGTFDGVYPALLVATLVGATISATANGGGALSYPSATLNQSIGQHGLRAGGAGKQMDTFTFR